MAKTPSSNSPPDSVTHFFAKSRTLFVGDVHGCSDELEILLEKVKPTRVILVGDMFTKGENPLQVWALIQKWEMEAVFGNHEEKVLCDYQKGRFQEFPKEMIDWIQKLPLWIEEEEFFIIHAGVHPFDRNRTSRLTALIVRRWPNGKNPKNPFWWELYRGDKLVIYGHDAKRKLQDHRPFTLGLDSGCVYGGHLTGYLLEEDSLIQVKAKRAYIPITNGKDEQK